MSSRLGYRFSTPFIALKARFAAAEALRFPLIVGTLFVLVAVCLFGVLCALVAGQNGLTQFDAAVHVHFLETSAQSPAVSAACQIFTLLGDVKLLAVFTVLGAAGLIVLAKRTRRHYDLLAFWIAGTAGAGLLNVVLKNLLQRPRPDQELALAPALGWSFPSGHVMGAFILFGMISYLVWLTVPRRAWSIATTAVLAVLVLAIGFSRVYLGAHWFSDVLGGYIAGIGWLAVCITGLMTYRSIPKQTVVSRQPEPVKEPAIPKPVVQDRPCRPKTPWRRARKAEGGVLASEAFCELRGSELDEFERSACSDEGPGYSTHKCGEL